MINEVNFNQNTNTNNHEYRIKPDQQKLFIKGHWYDMVDVHGMSMNADK